MKIQRLNKRREQKEILSSIVAKGGLYGRAAAMYINHKQHSDQFIRECAEQCHVKGAIDMWGTDLVTAIRRYSENTKK